MTLYEVKNIAKDLQFALCVTFTDAGYYFPARACFKEHFTVAFLHSEVRIFTIDFDEKIVFAHVRGCDE